MRGRKAGGEQRRMQQRNQSGQGAKVSTIRTLSGLEKLRQGEIKGREMTLK